MKKTITLNEVQLKEMVKNSLMEYAKHLNEAESEGWVVETNEVDDAYKLAVEEWGEDETNARIVRCIGDNTMAECLAFIFRQYNFRKWDEYKAQKKESEDDNLSSEPRFRDRDGRPIRKGSKVIWFDPDKSARDLKRVWTVFDMAGDMGRTGDVIHIADKYGEAEVYSWELKVVG